MAAVLLPHQDEEANFHSVLAIITLIYLVISYYCFVNFHPWGLITVTCCSCGLGGSRAQSEQAFSFLIPPLAIDPC